MENVRKRPEDFIKDLMDNLNRIPKEFLYVKKGVFDFVDLEKREINFKYKDYYFNNWKIKQEEDTIKITGMWWEENEEEKEVELTIKCDFLENIKVHGNYDEITFETGMFEYKHLWSFNKEF